MKQFIYSRLCYYTETYKHCLLQSVTDDKDGNGLQYEQFKLNFQIIVCHLEDMAKNIRWMTFPAKN